MLKETITAFAICLLSCFPAVNADSPWKMNLDAVEWDPGCYAGVTSANPKIPSEKKRDAVIRAWDGALELAASAKARFDKTNQFMISKLTASTGLTYADKLKLFKEMDPTYLQFFKGTTDPEARQWISSILDNIHGGINVAPGAKPRPKRPEGTVNILCRDTMNHPTTHDNLCMGDNGDKVYAFTLDWFYNDDVLPQGTYINFCRPFFMEAPSFKARKAAAGAPFDLDNIPPEASYTKLDLLFSRDLWESYIGTDAKIMLHEWTHIQWVGPTNPHVEENLWKATPPEVYGWLKCAMLARDTPVRDDGTGDLNMAFLKNADSFAWYAELGYWIETFGGNIGDLWPINGPLQPPVGIQ